jgi:hypothetical protein
MHSADNLPSILLFYQILEITPRIANMITYGTFWVRKSVLRGHLWDTPRYSYSWNTAKVAVKHQSIDQSIFSAYYLVCYTVANKLKFFTWNIRNFDIILYHITIISIRSSLLQSQTYLKICWFWSCDFLFSITDKTNNTNNTVGVLYEAETAYSNSRNNPSDS